jgi:putative heme-binding domain-containing protein
MSDNDLRTVVTTGIQGTAMPPFKFDAAELAGVVAFIRNMRDFDAAKVTVGDPVRGRVVFNGVGGCTTCHRVKGDGSRAAPDLSDIGSIRTLAALEQSLLNPTAAMRASNRSVRAVMRNGSVITGRRLNEDTYTVQLIDEQERLRSLSKADLREYTVLTTSPMPSFTRTLTAEQRADVVAYLLSLKGI